MTHTGIRLFDIVAYITAPIECETVADLPPQMQDAILQALELKSKEVELPLAIVAVRCDIDHGETPDKDRPYLHVVASEVVMADERTIRHHVEKHRAKMGLH